MCSSTSTIGFGPIKRLGRVLIFGHRFREGTSTCVCTILLTKRHCFISANYGPSNTKQIQRLTETPALEAYLHLDGKKQSWESSSKLLKIANTKIIFCIFNPSKKSSMEINCCRRDRGATLTLCVCVGGGGGGGALLVTRY